MYPTNFKVSNLNAINPVNSVPAFQATPEALRPVVATSPRTVRLLPPELAMYKRLVSNDPTSLKLL